MSNEEWFEAIKRSVAEHPLTDYETKRLLDYIDALKSEHAAQLQAACVELREKAATCCAERANELEEGAHVYAPDVDPFADRRQSSIGELREVAKLIRLIPIPTAALETALAEARDACITTAQMYIDEATGPTGGWLCSPKKLSDRFESVRKEKKP